MFSFFFFLQWIEDFYYCKLNSEFSHFLTYPMIIIYSITLSYNAIPQC